MSNSKEGCLIWKSLKIKTYKFARNLIDCVGFFISQKCTWIIKQGWKMNERLQSICYISKWQRDDQPWHFSWGHRFPRPWRSSRWVGLAVVADLTVSGLSPSCVCPRAAPSFSFSSLQSAKKPKHVISDCTYIRSICITTHYILILLFVIKIRVKIVGKTS